jgi:hypothetical protein
MGKTDVEEYNPRDPPAIDSRQAGWRGGHAGLSVVGVEQLLEN